MTTVFLDGRRTGAAAAMPLSAATLLFIKRSRLSRGSRLCRACQSQTHPFSRRRTGNQRKARAGDGAPTDAVDDHGFGSRSRFGVHQQNARALGSKVLVAPGEQRGENGPEIPAEIGQDVFVPRWLVAIALSLEEATFHQR